MFLSLLRFQSGGGDTPSARRSDDIDALLSKVELNDMFHVFNVRSSDLSSPSRRNIVAIHFGRLTQHVQLTSNHGQFHRFVSSVL